MRMIRVNTYCARNIRLFHWSRIHKTDYQNIENAAIYIFYARSDS